MYNFNRLEVYRRADAFSDVGYRASRSFPKFEMYALGDQMRRVADSVVLNIAEGGGKKTNAEMLQFLRYAIASSNELEAQVGKVWKLGYLKEGERGEMSKEIVEVRKMLLSFMKRFRKGKK